MTAEPHESSSSDAPPGPLEVTPGPVYCALWGLPVDEAELGSEEHPLRPGAIQMSEAVFEVVRRRWKQGAVHDASGRLSADLLAELATARFWGFLVPEAHGGIGASYREFVPFVTRLAAWEASLANLTSVHGCLGPAGVLRHFGSTEQQGRWLPALARGERLGVFGLTEPGAGSDLSALRTVACREGEHYLVSGEKMFITNLSPGRLMVLVCRIDNEPAVLIVELPEQDTENCRFVDYGIHAARRSGNRGVVFRDFAVPAANRVCPPRGNGLTIAYRGLNAGRMTLCAVVAGNLRRLLAGLIPWVRSRETHGQPIGERQLVQRRLGRLAALIVGCDALAGWCAALLDQGFRGEMECVVAKVFAAEAQKEATIELALRTHGGRSFLQGNFVGDSLPDLLAPCIYEGENELLGLGLFRSVTKGRLAGDLPAVADANVFKVDDVVGRWGDLFRDHGQFAVQSLRDLARETDAFLRSHGTDLDSRQCQMADISTRLQKLMAVLVVGTHGSRNDDALTRLAAACLVTSLRREVVGGRAAAREWQAEAELGKAVLAEGWSALADVPVDPVQRLPTSAGPR